MEYKIKDFLENHTDIYKDITKEVLQLGKEKIKNDEFFQLIIALETADDYFESYQFYAKLSENPDYEKNTLHSILVSITFRLTISIKSFNSSQF